MKQRIGLKTVATAIAEKPVPGMDNDAVTIKQGEKSHSSKDRTLFETKQEKKQKQEI